MNIFALKRAIPFTPKERHSLKDTIPKTFSLYSVKQGDTSGWWKEFNDPELNEIIRVTLSENLSIKQSWSRLRQAHALLAQKGADIVHEPEGFYVADTEGPLLESELERAEVWGGKIRTER